MPAAKMHADEVPTDPDLVRRLIAAQFPQWADLPIKPLKSAGTDNAMYRLGETMIVRLPRRPLAVAQVESEQRWLPVLAPHLPLPIPTPLAQGQPGDGYPWVWSIVDWLPGETATAAPLTSPYQLAADLARFITALHRIDPTGGPPPSDHNSARGVPLARRDARTRACIAELGGQIDAAQVTAAWDAALNAPVWDGPPVWIHGDLLPGNLLIHQGRLSAVIDFGCLGVGDPACDLLAAWATVPAETRSDFRAALGVDDATWTRGGGWALSFGLIALPYYQTTNPVLAGIARHAIAEVLADFEAGRV